MLITALCSTPKDTAKAGSKPKPKSEAKDGSGLSLPAPSPELMDLFTRHTAAEQQLQLITEHEAQINAQRLLHEGRIAALREQLQVQLFTIWNEVWMQREKAHNDAFKAWLKLLVS